MHERDGTEGVLCVGAVALMLPGGRVYDVPRRALLSRLACEGSASEVTAVLVGEREVAVQAALKELSATDLRTGELVWRRTLTSWVSELAVVHAAGRPLVGMREVKKYGDGARTLVDPLTGNTIDTLALGAAYVAGKGLGRYFGDAQHTAHYAVLDGATLRLHRASDGAQVGALAWSEAGTEVRTSVNRAGDTVHAQGFDFGPAVERVFFGPDELLAVDAVRLARVGYDGALRGSVARPEGARVRFAAWHEGAWLALFARTSSAVELARLEGDALRVLESDCDGVALVQGELLTASLRVRPLGATGPGDALPERVAVLTTARAPGPIAVAPELLATLAKLRAIAKDTGPVGLSLAELSRAETALGRELPSWVLAVLAARSGALKRNWKPGLDALLEHTTQLAAREAEYLAQPEYDRRVSAFPAGMVALGARSTARTVKEGHSRYGRRYRVATTTWWCAAGDESYLLERAETQELTRELEPDPAKPASVLVKLEGPFGPSHVLAELLHALLEKELGKGFAKAAVQAAWKVTEARAVEALPTLPLLA